jgi:small-conductance mechanosensitive channel
MTPEISFSGELAESLFLVIRMVLGLAIMAVIAVCVRLAILTFAGTRYHLLGRRKYWWAGLCLLAVGLLEGLRRPDEAVLSTLGNWIGAFRVVPDPAWPSVVLIGVYHTLAATLGLVLAIQGVGALYWGVDRWLAAWRGQSGPAAPSDTAADIRLHLLKAASKLNHILRTALLIGLMLAYMMVVLRLFPLTAETIVAGEAYLGAPALEIARAIVSYLPNMGYLVVIGALGWLALRVLRYSFEALALGTLRLRGFYPEWAEPTYKLVRTLLLLFLLMLSFPFLPGAGSQFFQGFTVFIGALITLGSAGAIGNIVAGTVLTYTRAFHVGDMVQIGGTHGVVIERNLLVTRVRAIENEEVTIPNSTVLSSAVVNFSSRGSTGGVVLKVSAGIGYGVDWRTVHGLMIDAAGRTEHILEDPSPQVWQTNLGDYAVNYELRAWTNRPEAMFEIHSSLRRNVLDVFNRAGVEIMTPSVRAHRDASDLAIPPEVFPTRGSARGIAVDVDRKG